MRRVLRAWGVPVLLVLTSVAFIGMLASAAGYCPPQDTWIGRAIRGSYAEPRNPYSLWDGGPGCPNPLDASYKFEGGRLVKVDDRSR